MSFIVQAPGLPKLMIGRLWWRWCWAKTCSEPVLEPVSAASGCGRRLRVRTKQPRSQSLVRGRDRPWCQQHPDWRGQEASSQRQECRLQVGFSTFCPDVLMKEIAWNLLKITQFTAQSIFTQKRPFLKLNLELFRMQSPVGSSISGTCVSQVFFNFAQAGWGEPGIILIFLFLFDLPTAAPCTARLQRPSVSHPS